MADIDSIRLPGAAEGTGRYHYTLNGEAAGIEEIFEVSGGGSSVIARRTAPGGTVLSVSIERIGDLDARCRLSLRRDANEDATALYALEDGNLEVSRNDGSRVQVVGNHGRAVLSPLMRVFQGPAIAAVLRACGECAVVVPALDPDDPRELLAPNVQSRRAHRLGVEAVRSGDTATVLRHCRYVGGNYDDSADFWLDHRDRLVRYRFPQSSNQLWEVELVED